jgi:hypothetical protein
MKLSSRARRFVTEAVMDLSDDQVTSIWQAFEHRTGDHLSRDVAYAALRALEHAESDLPRRLTKGIADEDEYSDLVNDLGFIQAIEGDLRQQVE